MKDNEYGIFEDRYYLSPTVSRDEQLSFIDTLRDTQQQHTNQINTDTYNLGTRIQPQFGGLGGGEETFIAQYQTPQTNQTVAELRQAAQQTALNQALSNLQNAYKKRYNDAVLNYQKRAATPTSNNPNNTPDPDKGLPIDTNSGSGEGVRYSDTYLKAMENFTPGSFKETLDALQNISDSKNSGDSVKAQSIPFFIPNAQVMNGGPFATGTNSVTTGVVYRNNRGAVTGMAMNGKEYGAEEAVKMLQQLASQNKIYGSTGEKFSVSDFSLTSAPLTTRPVSSNRGGRVNTLRK